MFVEPLKEAVFLDMNLLFRRMHDKRDDTDLSTYANEHSSEKHHATDLYEINIPYTEADLAKEENNSDIRISKDNPRVFLCATLWREERHEMLQLLKSLFR